MLNEKFLYKEGVEQPKESIETMEPAAFLTLSNPEWRREVLERVDQLIEQIKDNNIEELIFLDKSARPLSWLLRERWKHKTPKGDIPKIKYIDFGLREKNGESLGEETVVEKLSHEAEIFYKSMDKRKQNEYTEDNGWFWKNIQFARGENIEGDIWMSRKHITKLWKEVILNHPELIERIRQRYGSERGKILIIDDLLFSGTTLSVAIAAFAEAYPRAEVYGVHFFNQESKSPRTQIPWFKNQQMIGIEEDEGSLTTKRYTKNGIKKPNLSSDLRRIIKEIANSNLSDYE